MPKAQMKYGVYFQIQVKNLGSEENSVDVILPFPLQTFYQKILGRPRIFPKTGKIKIEAKFKNKYIHWQNVLKPNEDKIFKLGFKVSVKPRNEKLKSPDKSYKQFLKKDKFIDVNNKVIKMSKDLVENVTDKEEKVRILNDFVVNNLEYGNPIEGLYSSSDALRKEKVDCGGFDTLLAALCIAQKIPVRLISGFFVGFGPSQMHAWLEINLASQGWIVADPSIEKLSKEGRSKKKAKLGFVDCDRIALSKGHNFRIKVGKKFVNLPILQNPKVWGKGRFNYSYTFESRIIK